TRSSLPRERPTARSEEYHDISAPLRPSMSRASADSRATEDELPFRARCRSVVASRVGLGFEVLVHVTMDRKGAATIATFEEKLAKVAAGRSAERLFGDPDYLLRVVTDFSRKARSAAGRCHRTGCCPVFVRDER